MNIKMINNVGHIFKIFPTLIFLFLSFATAEASNSYKVPDFAFPKTVETQSDSILKKSLQTGDELMALRNAMNLAIARNELTDSESVGANINLFDSLYAHLSPIYQRLTYLIQADILNQFYSQGKYKFDQRKLSLNEVFPDNPSEWSGEMFKKRILDLVLQATDNLVTLPTNPINDISLLITDCNTASKIGLSVNEFIAFKGASLLKDLSGNVSATVIPFYSDIEDSSLEGKCKKQSIFLLNSIITDLSKNNSVVKSIAMVDISDLLPDYKLENYLKECREALKNSEGEGNILLSLWSRYGRDNFQYYDDIKNWLKKYPSGFKAYNIEQALAEMTKEMIELEIPKSSLCNIPVSAKAKIRNINKSYLLVYKLSQNEYDKYDGLILKKFNYKATPVHTVEIEEKGSVPYAYSKDVLLPAMEAGLYAVIPSKSRKLPNDWNKNNYSSDYVTLRITDIAIITSSNSNEKNSGKVYVVDGVNQKPLSGATVAYFSGDTKYPKGKFVTNEDGWVKIPENGYFRVEASYKGNVSKSDVGFGYYKEDEITTYHSSIFTDLEIYRPGDTLNYAVVGWKQDKLSNSLLKDTPVEIIFRDANYTKIGSDTLILNAEGRATGKFEIPKGRLLGRYQITASYPEIKNSGGGSVAVFVEEYKLPTFLVTMQQSETSTPGDLKFQGLAQTFTGMPVSGAKGVIKVEYSPWRWWAHGINASYTQEIYTDADGNFEFNLPTNNLKGTIFEKGKYIVTADVTSEAGETVKSSPLNFYLGSGLETRPSIPSKVEAIGDSIKFNVPVYDMAGLPVVDEVEYKIIDISSDSSVLTQATDTITGHFSSPTLSLDTKQLTSGKYRLEFKTADEENFTSTETIIWRADDTSAPFATPLWVPVTDFFYSQSESKLDVCFGSYWEEWILYILSDGKNILKTEWLSPQNTLRKISVDIPDTSPTLFISLSGLHNLNAETAQIKIVPKKSLEKLEIKTISFRDNISAGDKENWTFKFKTDSGVSPNTNVMAVMTDKALNSIYDFKWLWNISNPSIYNRVSLNSPRVWNTGCLKIFTVNKPSGNKYNGSPIPDWETYNYGLVSSPYRITGRTALIKARATQNASKKEMMDFAEGGVVEEAMVERAVSSNMAMADMEMAMDDASTDSSDSSQDTELRPVEMPVAFFMPELKANEDGELDVKFTVPNFNTTWQFQIAAYNDELLNSTLILDAVSTKPVMVKTNLPQYLRTGDKAEISASLFNNSDKEILLGGRMEIINPATGKIICIKEFSPELIAPSASRMTSINFEVPANLTALTVRTYAEGSNHSDGEQGIIPVLPSSTPVTEAKTFYASSDQQRIEVTVTRLDKDANVTLKYCDNPLWEVLLSLPSITETCNASALSISHWLFASLLANDIINTSQDISKGLKNILSSSDSTLSMSNLEKDANLKITALEASPWLNNSITETSRIRSLEKYFNHDAVASEIELKIAALKSLQNSDGGWSWFEGMKSSPFITGDIINVLGYLNSKNLLTADLKQMAKRGIKYYDTYLLEIYEKNKKFNVSSALNYFYTREMIEKSLSGKLKKVKAETLDSVVSQWRHWDIGSKAKGALLLLNEPNYKKEAETIIASLKQFLGTRIPLNQEALLLELFTKTESNSEAIEIVMQNMFLQKETQDWGSSYNLVPVIYSLVKLSPAKNIGREMPEILIGKQRIRLSETQAITGNYTINLNPSDVSGKKVLIKRQPGLPAWGGIVSQYVSPIADVKSEKMDNLSIEKRIYQTDSKGEVKEVSSLRKGDKVTVSLNLTVGKDMEFIVISDSRSACLQPDDKTSGYTFKDGLWAYREIQSAKTSFFIENLPAGRYVISYECHADRDGEYSLGITEVQCLYSPAQVAHSSGKVIKVL